MLDDNRHTSRRILALFALAVTSFACGRVAPASCPDAGSVEVRIPLAGLWTNPNDFDAPPGSCEVLDNMTQDRPGIWEPRRGFGLLQPVPTITGPINEGTSFRGSIIVHHDTASISRWTGSAWSTYSGTFTPPTQAASGRVHFEQMNESLFVTTSAGVYELDSPTGTWRLTGAPKALDGTATLRRTVDETGFATAGGQWAYREEWGIKNANGRLQIGPPSGRVLVQSPATVIPTTAHVAKLNGSTTVTVTSTTHGYVTGEYVDVTLGGVETWFAAGTFQVTRVSDTSFTYSDAVNNSSGSTQNPAMPITYGFTSGRGVTRVITIPAGITTDNFVQSYRSGKSASATAEPNDQLAQVYERSPTNLEIAAGSMTFVDITPDDFRGALIDIAGETILAAKYQPPTAADATQYHNCGWYSATRAFQKLDLQLIAVGGNYGLQSSVFLHFYDGTDPSTATWTVDVESAAAEDAPNGAFKLFTTGSASQNIADTARSIVRAINGVTNINTTIYAEYISGDAEAPGKIRVYARSPTVARFAARVSTSVGGVQSGNAFIPTLPTYTLITDMARSGSTVTVNMAYAHSYASGQQIQLAGSSNTSHFPNGVKTITVVDADTFTYTEAGSTVTAEANTGIFLSLPTTDVTSDVISRTDRLAYALPDRPWSVPLPNELFIEGAPTTTSSLPTALRIVANRDRLYVWADAGLGQVTGYYPDFALTTLASPTRLLAPETAVSMGSPGRVYGLADTGFLEVMTGAQSVSTPIQNILQALQVGAPAALKNYAFAVAYPSDFKVLLFLPESSSDTKATNAYVFHTRTGDWSRWDLDATTGWIDPVTDKLYLGLASGAVWVERKARTLADYYDPTAATFAYSALAGAVLTVAATTGLSVGDLVTNAASGTETAVTALDATHITLASATGWASTGTAVQSGVAITSTIRPTRYFGKEGPNVDKEIDSGLLLVQPPASSPEFTSLSLSFRNDYDPTFSTPEVLSLDSVVTSQLPFQVPVNMQRSGWLQWEISHSKAGARFYFLGASLNVRGSGVKAGP